LTKRLLRAAYCVQRQPPGCGEPARQSPALCPQALDQQRPPAPLAPPLPSPLRVVQLGLWRGALGHLLPCAAAAAAAARPLALLGLGLALCNAVAL